MLKKIAEKFKGDRKYFSIVFFILIILVVSGIVTENYIDKTKSDWSNLVVEKISKLENSIKKDYNFKQDDLLQKLSIVKKDLRSSLKPENETYKELLRSINNRSLENFSIEIFAPNGKLIAWNNRIALNPDGLFPLSFPLGEVYFLSNDIVTNLAIIDTAHIQSDDFYIALSTPIEELIKINNQFSKNISFTQDVLEKYEIDAEIDYSPYSEKSKDGRKYSFELINNNGNKIGVVSFVKPSLNNSINIIRDYSTKIQSLLVLFALIFVGLGLMSDFKKIHSYLFRFILLIVYLVILRVLIFVFGFPSNFISGPLSNPAYFSSPFAWGFVKSPIEFFTTIFFVLIISIQFFRYTKNHLLDNERKTHKKYFIAAVLGLSVIIFLLIRGISATIRSIVFDSTIRYFKEPNLIPDFPSIAMNLNMLLFTFAAVLLILGFLNIILSFIDFRKVSLKHFLLLVVLNYLVSFIAYYISNDPLLTPIMLFMILLFLHLLYYQVIVRVQNSIYNYLIVLLVSSVISISLLNLFNTKLEKESLKTTSWEINRTDSNLLSFMLDETIRSVKNDKNILSQFGERFSNYDAIAFKLWAKSPMQRESLNSGIQFYNNKKQIIGKYLIGIQPDNSIFNNISKDDEIIVVPVFDKQENVIDYYSAVIEIRERGILRGYVAAFVDFNIKSIGAFNYPTFLESNLSVFNKVVDVKQLKIFQFKDGVLNNVYGDIYPSRDQIKQILNTEVDSLFNESWLKINFNSEKYEAYLLKSEEDDSEILTVVAIQESAFSWDLFKFFKIFIIHSLFIIIAYLIIILLCVRKISLTFKAKLLLSFLFISIIPVVVLAVYNANLVTERGKEEILNELSQRADYIEKNLTAQLSKFNNRDLITASQNASDELGMSFALYLSTDQIYNSNDIYNKIGLMHSKLNPKAYYFLNYLKYQEFITSEKVNNYQYDSYFRFIRIKDKDYILSVNDAFNKIRVTISTNEINVVIFGIYSFAVIIIIIISTIFANQISQPIQRLTKATDAVSKGDLNVTIEHNERGELKDLLDGFNQMTSELKKNQAEIAEMEREAAWKEMAKQVAHEIKNPLTPMKLALQQLIISYKDKSKDFDKLFEKVSTTVLNQIENLNHIASEFSHFAKMPSLKIEEVDLLNVLNDTVNMFMHEKINIIVSTDLKNAAIDADVGQLRRMFINLIRNSIQADASVINLEIYVKENKFILTIKDNGKGIPALQKEKIFEENFTTKKHGMGLGLSLAKRFMTNISGEITLKESSSEGSTFELIFPAKKII